MQKLGILLAIVLTPILLNAATYGPEVATARQQYFSAFGTQASNALACGADSCVALWAEYDWARNGVYSSVIDSSGNVQPATSNLLHAGNERDASVVWTGDHYLATWFDLDTFTFFAAPLSRDGRISGAVQTILTRSDAMGGTALAWNGRHAFVVFNTGKLSGAILNADGTVVRQVALPTVNSMQWAVAAVGQTFGVVWVDSVQSTSTVKFQRYGDDASPIDQTPIMLAENFPVSLTKAGIAGNATQFGVAYAPAVDSTIFRLRIDASTGAIERLPVTSFVRELSGVYWSSDDFVAYGQDGTTIGTERFSSDGVRVLNVTSNKVSDTRLASSSAGSVAVWTDAHLANGTQHVLGSLLDTDATAIVKGNLRVSLSALPQTAPALAASPQGALLAWNQPHDRASTDVMVQRLNTSGVPIDGEPITLAANVSPDFAPACVWLGNAYLVVWNQTNPEVLFGKRVSASGMVLDANPIEFAAGFRPVLVSNGTLSVLAFSRGAGIAVLRLDANGGALDSQPIPITSMQGSSLAAASNGSEFVVVWMDGVFDPIDPPDGTRPDIYAVRLTSSGQPIETAPIAIANGVRAEGDPAIASDGRDFVIAYTDGKVVTKRLLAEGSLSGTTSLDEGTAVDENGGSKPAIGWSGTQYVITWSVAGSNGWTVASTTLDRTGAPLDLPRAIAHSDSLIQPQGAVASARGGALIAYARADAADIRIPRMYTRHVLDESPRGRGVRH